jgi:predicted nucleic acid-binding protein
MNEKEFELLFGLVMEDIKIVPDKKIKAQMKKAIDVMKDIDINDSPILACAFAIPNEGIWSEDKDFYKQNIV